MHMDHEHNHEHVHGHAHEHTHDGIVHTHEHLHEHTHSHEHPHSHDNLHSENCSHEHSHDHATSDQLFALMKYMVAHNESHAKELADVAHQLAHTGNAGACEKIMSAVADFNAGNQKLSDVLAEMNK